MLHSFSRDVARQHGDTAALLLQYLAGAIERAGQPLMGHRWFFHSLSDFQAHYPYLSANTINRAINGLVAARVLVVDRFNRRRGDRTRWFRFQDEEIYRRALAHAEPVYFQSEDAERHGLLGAVLLHHLRYRSRRLRQEWIPLSARAHAERIPFTKQRIQRALDALVEAGALRRSEQPDAQRIYSYRVVPPEEQVTPTAPETPGTVRHEGGTNVSEAGTNRHGPGTNRHDNTVGEEFEAVGDEFETPGGSAEPPAGVVNRSQPSGQAIGQSPASVPASVPATATGSLQPIRPATGAAAGSASVTASVPVTATASVPGSVPAVRPVIEVAAVPATGPVTVAASSPSGQAANPVSVMNEAFPTWDVHQLTLNTDDEFMTDQRREGLGQVAAGVFRAIPDEVILQLNAMTEPDEVLQAFREHAPRYIRGYAGFDNLIRAYAEDIFVRAALYERRPDVRSSGRYRGLIYQVHLIPYARAQRLQEAIRRRQEDEVLAQRRRECLTIPPQRLANLHLTAEEKTALLQRALVELNRVGSFTLRGDYVTPPLPFHASSLRAANRLFAANPELSVAKVVEAAERWSQRWHRGYESEMYRVEAEEARECSLTSLLSRFEDIAIRLDVGLPENYRQLSYAELFPRGAAESEAAPEETATAAQADPG